MENQEVKPVKKISLGKKILGVTIGAIIMLVIIGSFGGKSDQAAQSSTQMNKETQTTEAAKEESIKITAEALAAAYKENQVNADNIYKGKLVEVSGTVKSIGKDFMDNPYVAIKGNESFIDVQCFVDSDGVSAISTLKPDQSIKMEGNVDGYLMNVSVKHCKVIQ